MDNPTNLSRKELRNTLISHASMLIVGFIIAMITLYPLYKEMRQEIANMVTTNKTLEKKNSIVETYLETSQDYIRRLYVTNTNLKEDNQMLQYYKEELETLKESVYLIELSVYEQEDGSFYLKPRDHGEFQPFKIGENGIIEGQRFEKNLLYTSETINSDAELYFRFSIPYLSWYENSEFVAISPSGDEQLIEDVPPSPPGSGFAIYQFSLKEHGIYTIDLRNLDNLAEHTSFTLIW